MFNQPPINLLADNTLSIQLVASQSLPSVTPNPEQAGVKELATQMGVMINMMHTFGNKISGMEKRLTALDIDIRCVKDLVDEKSSSRSSQRDRLSPPVTPATSSSVYTSGSREKIGARAPDPRAERLVEVSTREGSNLRVSCFHETQTLHINNVNFL